MPCTNLLFDVGMPLGALGRRCNRTAACEMGYRNCFSALTLVPENVCYMLHGRHIMILGLLSLQCERVFSGKKLPDHQ